MEYAIINIHKDKIKTSIRQTAKFHSNKLLLLFNAKTDKYVNEKVTFMKLRDSFDLSPLGPDGKVGHLGEQSVYRDI